MILSRGRGYGPLSATPAGSGLVERSATPDDDRQADDGREQNDERDLRDGAFWRSRVGELVPEAQEHQQDDIEREEDGEEGSGHEWVRESHDEKRIARGCRPATIQGDSNGI